MKAIVYWLCAVKLQLLHSKNCTSEGWEGQPWADKQIYQLWNFFHTAFHLFEKDNKVLEKVKIHSWKQQIVSETHIRKLRWLVVDYDPSTQRIANIFVINLHIYPERRCNGGWWILFWCKVQHQETVTTVIPTASGVHFQLMQASFAVNCSLFTSSLFQAVPIMHFFICFWCLALEGLSSHLCVRI